MAAHRGQLEWRLTYKCGHLAKVDAAYTLQTCAVCIHMHGDNRPSQAGFACDGQQAPGACWPQRDSQHPGPLATTGPYNPRDRGLCTVQGVPAKEPGDP